MGAKSVVRLDNHVMNVEHGWPVRTGLRSWRIGTDKLVRSRTSGVIAIGPGPPRPIATANLGPRRPVNSSEPRPTCIYVATHTWNSPIRVGSHHLSVRFAKSMRVLYVSHPVSLASLINPADNHLRNRLVTLFGGGADALPAGMQQLAAFAPFAPSNRWPLNRGVVVDHAWRASLPRLKPLLRRTGFDAPDVLVVDAPYQSFWPDLVDARRLCVRIADLPKGFGGFAGSLEQRFVEVLARADLVVAPTRSISAWAESKCDSPVVVVPNGVDTRFFRRPQTLPEEFRGESRPKVLFVGAVGHWVDLALVRAAAAMAPELAFYLVGPAEVPGTTNGSPENLFVLGPRAYDQIPAYTQHADVGIAPFDVAGNAELVGASSALKIYEYLGSGLPVVATAWPQTRSMADYVVIADQQPKSFLAAIRRQLACSSRVNVPQEVVESWDWDRRFGEIQSALGAP